MSSYNTPEKDEHRADDPGRTGHGPKEEREIQPGQEGRCSSCGEEISGTEAEVVLRHPHFPGDDLYFHEAEECSEPALVLADTYPREWTAWMRLPNHWGDGLIGPRYSDEEQN